MYKDGGDNGGKSRQRAFQTDETQVQSSRGRRLGRPGDQGGRRACLASEQWGKVERERTLQGEVGM